MASLSFLVLYVLLNRPEVILFSRIGFVAWYPAIGDTSVRALPSCSIVTRRKFLQAKARAVVTMTPA